MNRMKKEEIRKYNEARKGLTSAQIQLLDAKEEEDRLIDKLANVWHAKRFSEEYDLIYDSGVDAAERSRGINPMSDEYIANVNEKRIRQGVSPLSECGRAQSDETMQLCLKEAREGIDSIRTRIDEILFYKWDPIRLSNSNTARNEYSMYVGGVFELALDSEKPEPLADHLTYLSTRSIGVTGSREQDIAAAALIFSIVHDCGYYPDHVVIEID